MLVIDGEVEVVTSTDRVRLSRGEAVFVGHEDGPFFVKGEGRVAVGAVPS